ncbi:MAG TPA: hypothetical protein VLK23_16545, partial [Thermodesulfobacteriota bacterium]|nr:hypothetical protein [Thermodesulfobacteriota bacterium]
MPPFLSWGMSVPILEASSANERMESEKRAESRNGELVPRRYPYDSNWKLQVYTELPVFIRGLKGMDKKNRHGGRVLNHRNPSAMPPTRSEDGRISDGED